MRIKLYKHNESAYKNALELLRTEKKAAVIHPTGTGKSFIAFKLCEDNPNKNICWLSPSEYIFTTQLENLKKATDGYIPQNICFFTYAKLMNMTNEEIAEIKPDYIILDEFHRCGAQMWGQGVEALLSAYPDTPILGLSATAIRYLDNQRNMADELFDGNIASEMTLGDAIVRGILSPPKYVLSSFSCQKDLNKYKRRVNKAKSKVVRDKGEEYLEALRRALDKADGLDVIFDKHITDRTGKYIIFCADYNHLCKMVEMASEWFYKIDPNPHIYSFYTEDPSSDKSFKEFKEDNDNTHLRLLYCIDALNEGVHVENISGVMLLRPTVSPIVYKQQIGRALQTGINRSSVIFDVVMNIENLYSIGSIEEEMKLAISYYRSNGLEDEIVNEHFNVIDEVKDCIEIFDKLNETLTASWDYMYYEAKKYYEINGNLNVPKRYKTENGYSLGSWLITQRRVFSGMINGILTEERIDKLNKIGMVWENHRDSEWQKYFSAAQKYYADHGDLNVQALYITDDGVKLGTWISRLRMSRKNGADSKFLTEGRIKALDEIGMIWDVSDYLWQRYYGACLTFYGINHNLDIPLNYVTGDGLRLGAWIDQIRGVYNRKNNNYRLSAEQIKSLTELGMVWEKKKDIAWSRGYAAAEEYWVQHGNLNVPSTYKTSEGYALGKWLVRQRQNKKLTKERKNKLNKIGMIWEKVDSWEMRYALAKEFYEKNGNLSMSTNYVINGIWLGKWLEEQRKKYNLGKLSDIRIKQLEKINMVWINENTQRIDEIWDKNYSKAKQYYDKNNNLDNLSKGTDDEKKLNLWLQRQRQYYKSGKLSQEKIEKLQSIGMVWNVIENAWETGFLHAKNYYEENGNLLVPLSYVNKCGYNLGIWISNQRNSYLHPTKQHHMSEEQAHRLEAIGMKWKTAEEIWEIKYKAAEQYFIQNGNLAFPCDYKADDGSSLVEWIRIQRDKMNNGTLSQDKIDKLNRIGIDWLSPMARRWENYFSACEKYYKLHGNLEIGTTYVDENGLAIGKWVKKMRKSKNKLKTSGENGNQIKRLESIGICWENTVLNNKTVLINDNEIRSKVV